MGLLGDILGTVVSGGIGVGGKIAYETNQKKKRDAFAEEFDRKQHEEAVAARDLYRTAPKDQSAELKKEIEAFIGITLEEAEKQSRDYNLLLEYDRTIDLIDKMREKYLAEHPPGSTIRTVRRVYGKVDKSNPHSATDYIPVVSYYTMPEDEKVWSRIVEDEFWRQEFMSFVGPCGYGGRKTYGVSTALYALGGSRLLLARDGFLPSNCAKTLWPYWNPYITWDGDSGVMNMKFKCRYDVSRFIPNTFYTHTLTSMSCVNRFYRSKREELIRFMEKCETERRLRPDLYGVRKERIE